MKTASVEFKLICCRHVSVCVCVCLHEKNANLAIFGSFWHPKIWLWRLATFWATFKISLATLDEFSVYFVVSKLLILAYFWATNLTYFSLKFVGILKCAKIREFSEFLKFITF